MFSCELRPALPRAAPFSFLSFQWKDLGKALISCGSLWVNVGCSIPAGAPGRTYLTSKIGFKWRRSEEGSPEVYSLNKESYSQDWGGLRWGLAYFHLVFLFLPGFVFYSLNENAPICTELASSSTHTLLGPSFYCYCCFLFLIPVHENSWNVSA